METFIDLPTGGRAWISAAACKDSNHDFYDPELETESKAICADCRVVEECLHESLWPVLEPAGVWGGHNGEERRNIRRRHLEATRAERMAERRNA